jgi:hypothetical protein
MKEDCWFPFLLKQFENGSDPLRLLDVAWDAMIDTVSMRVDCDVVKGLLREFGHGENVFCATLVFRIACGREERFK